MAEKTTQSFGARLKKERLNANLTQSELARQPGVNRIEILKTEAGSYSQAWN